LIEGYDLKASESAVTFVDDMLMLAHASTLTEANTKLIDMMEHPGSRLDWSCTHHCDFTMDKFRVMGLTIKWEPDWSRRAHARPVQRLPIILSGAEIPVVYTHKFLSILVDQELWWKEQANYALQKGMKWVTQYCRLAKPSKGVSAKYMRHFYVSVALPRMLYAADLFLIPQNRHTRGMKGFINKLAHIQRQACLHITGALRSMPTDTLDACSDLLPFHLLVEKVMH